MTFNPQRTLYLPEAEYNRIADIGVKLEREYPAVSFRKPGKDEFALSAIVRFLLKREYDDTPGIEG